MKVRPFAIEGAFAFTPTQHADDRGVFLEHYRYEALEEAIGHSFVVRQANTSVSRRGTLRGIHYALVPPGQAKYVTTTSGAVIDYVVDLRVGSPTFARWESVRLDDENRNSVYLAEGLGHAFVAVSEVATVTYLVSEVYNPQRELGLSPLDPAIGLVLPDDIGELLLSPKDSAAPTLDDAIGNGLLPTYTACRAYRDGLRR